MSGATEGYLLLLIPFANIIQSMKFAQVCRDGLLGWQSRVPLRLRRECPDKRSTQRRDPPVPAGYSGAHYT